MYSFACVVALNKIKAGGAAIPQDRAVEWTGPLKGAALGMLFGILWVMAWWTYSAKFVVMAAATTYYFNSNAETEGQAELLYSFKLAHIYHTGSIAAGAFIIAVIEFIKIIFLYFAKKAEKASGGNKLIKAVVCVAECVLSCIEKICDYVNQSAFAYICITGDGFFEGAWKGFLLNVKHMLDFTFANYIAKVFILLGKVTLVAVNSFTLVFIMKDATGVAEGLHSIWGAVALSGLITFITASLFLGIFENAVLALMTCLCVDMDLHDGEPKYGPATFHDSIEKVKKGNADVDEASDDEADKKASAMK
jgi:solute carrier family 44 (choline transporter-like protein), member 2/4/5